MVVGTPVTAEEEDADLLSLLIQQLVRFASDLAAIFAVSHVLPRKAEYSPCLQSGSADNRVDPAKDGAINFVISALTEQDVR